MSYKSAHIRVLSKKWNFFAYLLSKETKSGVTETGFLINKAA
jgi:hypothetical protein